MRSFSSKLCAPFAFGACVYLSTGCGSSPSNFYDAPSVGAGPAGGEASSAAGANAMGTAGSGFFGNGGQTGGSGGPGMGPPNNAPCSPAKDVSGGTSGEFGTTGPVCFRVMADIVGWGCSNFDGRTVKVNGQLVMCAALPLPDKIDGAYYFDVSAGMFDYASFYWF